MFRSSLANDSPHYSSLLTGNNGVANQLRRCSGCLTESAGVKTVNPASIWLRVTKVDLVMTAFYKEITSSYWVPYGKQLSLSGINSNGYYLGVAVTSHDNKNPNRLVSLQISHVDLLRECSSETITAEQCDQATNCEIGLRTSNCYDVGRIKTRRVKVHLPGTNYLHLAEVQVFDEFGNNAALNMPARMSSVFDENYFPYPGDGNDGIIVDNMFHTNIELNPWWEVDLGEELVEVKEIVVYNRNLDCNSTCQSRANGLLLSLIDNKGRVFDSRDAGVVQVETSPTPRSFPFSPISIGTYQTRKVKVQLTTTNYLHLTEIQVFDEAGENRALNKPAAMSSIYGTAADATYHPNPGEAVDGITTGPNMFMTDIENGAWWEVDLGTALVNVKQVVVFNRQDCLSCQSRFSNAVVSLIDDRGVAFDYKNVGDTSGVNKLSLNFDPIKKIVLPQYELEPVCDEIK